jgi:hypothetical protein
VGISSVKRYVATYREGRSLGRSLAPKKRPGSKPKLGEDARRSFWRRTWRNIRRRPCPRGASSCGAYVEFRSATLRFPGCSGAWVGAEKKIGGCERERRVLEGSLACSLVAGGLEAQRLVFVDEMGTNTSLAPLYAWSRRGERAPASVPRNWGANVTLLASMSAEGMGP